MAEKESGSTPTAFFEANPRTTMILRVYELVSHFRFTNALFR